MATKQGFPTTASRNRDQPRCLPRNASSLAHASAACWGRWRSGLVKLRKAWPAREVLDLGLDEAVQPGPMDHDNHARARAAAGRDVDVDIHRLSIHRDLVDAS